jgi:peroxiredoxin
MRRFILLLCIASLATACQNGGAKNEGQTARVGGGPIEMGMWRAVLTVPGGEIPFRFELSGTPEAPSAVLFNGEESVDIGEVSIAGDTLTLEFPAFNSRIRATNEGGALAGALRLIKRGGVVQDIPLRAEYAQGYTFTKPGEAPGADVAGRWDVTFVEDGGKSYRAIGEFREDGAELHGTFLTTTGDYRYLAGDVSGRSLQLSCFDGAHAYLFKATLGAGDTLSGDFWSGTKWHESWTGVRNPDATLPNPDSLTTLRPGYDTISFTFPDPEGHEVSFPSTQFDGKVVIVSIGGSWCPNCHDESVFLTRFYKERHARGLEVIGLMYEHYRDFEREARQVERFRKRDDIPYPLLVAGYSARAEASATLPMLDGGIKAFPTMIVMDRKGKVRKIHTGFAGPGTGRHYTDFEADFAEFVDNLLAE